MESFTNWRSLPRWPTRSTASQLGFVALEIERVEAERAKGRQGTRTDLKQQIAESGQARDKAASTVGVNRQYVSDAKRIEKEAPKLAERIKAGKMTITQAKREMKETAREHRREENRILIAKAPAPARRLPSGLCLVATRYRSSSTGLLALIASNARSRSSGGLACSRS
jgi:hypothetical protein